LKKVLIYKKIDTFLASPQTQQPLLVNIVKKMEMLYNSQTKIDVYTYIQERFNTNTKAIIQLLLLLPKDSQEYFINHFLSGFEEKQHPLKEALEVCNKIHDFIIRFNETDNTSLTSATPSSQNNISAMNVNASGHSHVKVKRAIDGDLLTKKASPYKKLKNLYQGKPLENTEPTFYEDLKKIVTGNNNSFYHIFTPETGEIRIFSNNKDAVYKYVYTYITSVLNDKNQNAIMQIIKLLEPEQQQLFLETLRLFIPNQTEEEVNQKKKLFEALGKVGIIPLPDIPTAK
jgi:hypothetical protein